MKIGKANKLLDANLTYVSTVEETPGMTAVNLINPDTGAVCQYINGAGMVTIESDADIQAEYIAIFNVNIQTSLKLELYDGSTLIFTQTLTAAQLPGLGSKNALFANPAPTTDFNKIVLTTAGASPTFETVFGYIYAFDSIDFGCAENIQVADNTNDSVTISRTNRPDTQKRYLFQSYQITTRKNTPFAELQGKIREIFSLGIGSARPVIFDEPMFNPVNLVYGILDAGAAKYDVFPIKDADGDYKSQTTVGIQEVT